jgi:hypothetical protein
MPPTWRRCARVIANFIRVTKAHKTAPLGKELYNPLKLDDQPQECWAKVRADFGVGSVTLQACKASGTLRALAVSMPNYPLQPAVTR